MANSLAIASGYQPQNLGARCGICPLKGQKPVPPTIPRNVRFVVIGEGPGRLEILRQEPFVGPSGKLLDRVLRAAGLKRPEALITNAMACRSEDDRPDIKLAATSCCAPRLANELKDVPRSTPILPLGKWGARALLNVATIFKARGFIWDAAPVVEEKIVAAEKAFAQMQANAKKEGKLEKRREAMLKKERSILLMKAQATYAGFRAVPTLHPAFILRGADGWYPVLVNDVKRFARLLANPKLKLEDKAKYRVASTSQAIAELAGPLGPTIAVDIETAGPNPFDDKLICVGMSDGKRNVVVYPWKRSLAGALRKVFKDRQVVMHFGIQFDMLVLRREGAWPWPSNAAAR